MTKQKFLRYLLLPLLCLPYSSGVFAAEMASVVVKQVQVPQVRVVDATIEAVHQATVSSQTGGRITEITVDVDDYVEKGTVIVRIRDKDQRAAFDAAKARYEEADAEYQRVKDVYEKKLVAKAALDKASAQLKAMRAAMEQAKEALDHTEVRAPYSGIVVKRHVEVGETARAGQELMTGLSLEKLRARVALPQSLIHDVRKYRQAWVWVGQDQQQQVKAESLTISPFADEQTHTFLVRLNLPDGEHHVYPGMHAKVAFLTGEDDRIVIPANAVARRSEVTGVYVKQNGKLQFRYVRLGRIVTDNQIEVLSGLTAGETVMLDPVAAAFTVKTQTNDNAARE